MNDVTTTAGTEPVRTIAFTVNDRAITVDGPPIKRLADALRDDLGLTGTKIGCNAGDCGACTVLLDGRQICACMVPVAQAEGRRITTVEGLAAGLTLTALQDAFHRHGAAQCGICTPGMLMAAHDLLTRHPTPSEAEVADGLGGVLCRCTGYRKIVAAVRDAAPRSLEPPPDAGAAVGSRMTKVDGVAKLTGEERYGADSIPPDALWLRVVRAPHDAARFQIGDLQAVRATHPGLTRILTSSDVPTNGFGIYPDIKDQPVLADGEVRFRGEAVLALVGTRDAITAIADRDLPVSYQPISPIEGLDQVGRRAIHADHPDNVLIDGKVCRGDVETAFTGCAAVAEGCFETGFVEHAYIEPEAGWARRVGERIEVHVSTQTAYMDRDEVAHVMGFAPDRVRIVPTACGGGFGGKLDLSVQPLIALAAWLEDKPVACVYDRPESMASSTKRHAARIRARFGCDSAGRLQAVETSAAFDTGAYASWGPTVANRVPVHATGPYRVPHVRNRGRAIYTNAPPAGAFRGFGVPQAAIAHECLIDDLAEQSGIDRLEIRLINAVRAGDRTATGQTLDASVGLVACLEALKPHWHRALSDVAAFNAANRIACRGVGIGCMWYGIGNTSLSNPSTIRVGLGRNGTLTLYSGALDIGQGSNTIMTQICADALGVPAHKIDRVTGDTDRTADAGKTSASRQTFVSGKATQIAAANLRQQILRLVNAGPDAHIHLGHARLTVADGDRDHVLRLGELPLVDGAPPGTVLLGDATFDPPTTPLDGDGQGAPYATYGFAAQMAVVEVDIALGTTKPLHFVAAHDVGRAINPTQVEGQIEGGIAQGLGLALIEEYLPGLTENLHDYLIPTIGDVPPIDCILIEDPDPLGPFGAKGVGEPGLVPTAPAVLGAIRHACGVRVTKVPVLPHRLHAALRAQEADHDR